MLWCQGAQNIGLSNHKLKSAKVHRVIAMHACSRQTDEPGNSATIRSPRANKKLDLDEYITGSSKG